MPSSADRPAGDLHREISRVLVVGAPQEREDAYRRSLEGAGLPVAFAGGHEAAAASSSERRALALVVDLDTLSADDALLAVAAAADPTSPLPVIFVATDVAPVLALAPSLSQPFDYVPWQAAGVLLSGKILMLVHMRRQAQALAAERRASADFKNHIGDHIHRTKNLLAIVQSIAMRTLAGGREPNAARAALLGRLRSIGRTYHLLAAGTGAWLGETVETELGDVAGRVSVQGPPVRISAPAVPTFGLVIHELATNAVQHGALRGDGSVRLEWAFRERGAERDLELVWSEEGATAVEPPAAYGFGLALASSLGRPPGANGAEPPIEFGDAGFRCRLWLAHDVLLPD